MEEQEHARQELYFWQYNRGQMSNFSSTLYALMGKADPNNQRKFSQGFPHEWEAFREWWCCGDQDVLFAKWKVQRVQEKK